MHSQGFATRNSAGAHKRLISTPRPPLKSLAAIKRPGSQQLLGFCRPTLCRTRSAVPDRPEPCSAHPPHNGFGRWRIAFRAAGQQPSKHQALSSTNISTSTSTSTNTSASTSSSTSTIRAPASNQLFCARSNGTARSDRKMERLSVPLLLAQTLSRFHYHSTNQRDNHGTTRWLDFRFDRS